MKKFKKLIPALCMLLVSAVLMGTSTYAWFSMNPTVRATGMQVVAKTDDTYLLISSTKTTAFYIQIENAVTTALTVADEEAKLYCAAPADATSVSYLTTSGKNVNDEAITTAGVVVADRTTAAAATNWYTARSASRDSSTISAETARQLVDMSGYVIKKTVYLTVANGMNSAENLKVSANIVAKDTGKAITGVKILVATDDNGFAILSTANSTSVDIKGNNTAISGTTVRIVDIYIYYDGNDTSVYTNGAANLSGATIDLTFDVTAKAAD